MQGWWVEATSHHLVGFINVNASSLNPHTPTPTQQEELAALSALDKLGAGSSASASGDEGEGGTKVVGIVPASDMLSVGMKIEYWWDEKEGWCTAKLLAKQELMGEVLTWTVQFDMDNDKQELKLNSENKARWRILRAGEGR